MAKKKSEQENDLDGMKVVEKQDTGKLMTEHVEDVKEKEVIPEQYSPEWNDFVLSKFLDSELIDGNPKVEGLRRVTRELLGPIVHSRAEVVQCPKAENDMRAVVTHEVGISLVEYGFTLATFKEVGDCHRTNTDTEFLKFQVPTASTRAEARALRKALGLNKVAAEELTEKESGVEAEIEYGAILPSQVQAIKMLCGRNGIDIEKFIRAGASKYDRLEDVLYDTACKMVECLQKYQQDQSKIPESLKVKE